MNNDDRELDFALAECEQENRLLRARNERLMIEVQLLSEAVRAQTMPPAPHECKTDAEKIAYAFGWFKALELNPARKLWVGLTTDEIFAELEKIDEHAKRLPKGLSDFAYAVQAKLKEKNNG